MFKGTATVLVLVMLLMSLSVQNASAAQVTEAQTQAQTDAHGGMWLAIGILTGAIGWIVALVMEPTPPASALLGKDPTYVAQYTDAYRSRVKDIRTNKALVGCLIGTAAEVVFFLAVLSASDY